MKEFFKDKKSIYVNSSIRCTDPTCCYDDCITLVSSIDGCDDITDGFPNMMDSAFYEEQDDGKLVWDGHHIVKSQYEVYYCKNCRTFMTRQNRQITDEVDFSWDHKCEACGGEMFSCDNIHINKEDGVISAIIGDGRYEMICPECKKFHVRRYLCGMEIFTKYDRNLTAEERERKRLEDEENERKRSEKKRAKDNAWNALPDEEKKRILHRQGKMTPEEHEYYSKKLYENLMKMCPEAFENNDVEEDVGPSIYL